MTWICWTKQWSIWFVEINSEKERLLCYAAGIMQATLSNPNNVYTPEGLIGYSVKAAQRLIDTIYDEEKLKEALK
jgi:hypothetical protein